MTTPTSSSSPTDADSQSESSGEGLSVLELAALPPAQLRVMRVLLRGVEMSYEALCAAVDNLPHDEQLSRPELDGALRVLVEQQWLIPSNPNAPHKYKANLHRKSSRTLSEFAPPRSHR